MAVVQHYNQTVTASLTVSVKDYFSIFTSLLKDEALRSRQQNGYNAVERNSQTKGFI